MVGVAATIVGIIGSVVRRVIPGVDNVSPTTDEVIPLQGRVTGGRLALSKWIRRAPRFDHYPKPHAVELEAEVDVVETEGQFLTEAAYS